MTVWLLAEQAHADSAMDILARLVDNAAIIITAICAGIAAIAARRAVRQHAATSDRIAQIGEDTAAVRDSTVNGHPRPMRYDLDDGFRDLSAAIVTLQGTVATIASSVQELQGQVRELGEQQEDDRVARRAGDKGLAARVEEQERIARLRHPEDMT